MTKQLLQNYDTFYNMILSTTIMSNVKTESLCKDAKTIIDFIGKAYRMDDTFIQEATDVILTKLIALGLTADQHAVYGSRQFGEEYTDEDVMFDIKGDVLTTLQNISSTTPDVNDSWFDYSHYKTYDPYVRFAKINIAGASGNIIAARQVGILRVLGIGCDVDLKEGSRRLLQCVMWGDMPSMYYLAYTYSLMGNEDKSKIFYGLAELSQKYLLAGCTVIPDEDKKLYLEESRNYYVYVSRIKQDIVYAHNKLMIDYSFIEALMSDKLDYNKRMEYINNYEDKQWKEVTNSSSRPTKKIGF